MSVAARLAQVGKPREVEGILDVTLIRPLGYLWVLALRGTPVTPNVVSWLSMMAAMAAAVAYFHRTLGGALLGLAFLLLSSALDSADGQLARATGRTSDAGMVLDGFCDNVSFIAIYLAAALSFVVDAGGPPVASLAVGFAAGYSHALQSSLVDLQRQLFLYYGMGQDRVVREDLAELRAELAAARGRGVGRWPRVLAQLRLWYCERQQRWSPSSMALLRAYQEHVSVSPELRDDFAARYRERNRNRLRAWALMASNSHKVGIVVCSFLPFVGAPEELARLGLFACFTYNLALNVPLLFLIWTQRRADRILQEELREGLRRSEGGR